MTTLFNIPIYRVSPEKYEIESQKKLNKLLEDTGYTEEEASTLYEITRQRFWKEVWYPREFNDVIGWIQLIPFVSNLQGELFLARKNRFSWKMKDKFFYLIPQAKFDVRLSSTDSSNEIHNKVRAEILELMKAPKLKNRYVDLSTFDAVAPHTDWKTIIKNCQPVI